MAAIGIDFGTTNSVLAQFSNGAPGVVRIDSPPDEWAVTDHDKLLPSVYALGPDRTPLFGWAAKRQVGNHKLAAIKRLFQTEDTVEIGDETVYVEEVAAQIFGQLRRAALEEGVDFSRAVVTVPANSRGLARYRTKICAGMAGIEVAALINEPTAAAMAFAQRESSDKSVMVVDWGGGTLDVTILNISNGVFIEESSKGIQHLGGLDFDRVIYQRLTDDIPDVDSWDASQVAFAELEVERAKIMLSNQDEVSLRLPDGNRRALTRRRLAEWVADLIHQVDGPVETCLADRRMSFNSIDQVVLVGGTCMMPAVRDHLTDLLGQEPAKGVTPMTAIAEGASIAAAILAGEYDADFFVSTEHALGTVAVDGSGGLEFSPVIPRNQKLPARESSTYVPVSDFQEVVRVNVIEGDPDEPLDHPDNVVLKEWEIALDPKPMSEAGIEVEFQYDVDGILHVSVTESVTGKPLHSGSVAFAARRDPRELVGIADRVSAAGAPRAVSPQAPVGLPQDVQDLVGRACDKVIAFVPDEDAQELTRLVEQLVGLAQVGEPYQVERLELEAALRRFSYLY